ncbi:MAG: CARDB domain-containing protein, partial [Patescibacteria group bacterium]
MFARKIFFIFSVIIFFYSFLPFHAEAAEENIYDDLAIDSISVTPSKPAIDQYCVITVKIKNNGTKNLFTSTGLTSFSFSFDNFLKEASVYPAPSLSEPIMSGNYFYYIFSGRFLSSGTKKLNFIVDEKDEMKENNENNNSGSLTLIVYNLNEVDLSVNKITLSQEKPLVNTSLNISVEVINSGKASLTADAGLNNNDVSTAFDGFVISEKEWPDYPTIANPFDPGEVLTYTFTGFFNKIGDNNLKFSLDNNRRLAESNENNNSTSTITTVYSSAIDRDEFFVSNITVSLISSSSVAITWQSNELTIGYVSYKTEMYYSDTMSAITREEKEHRVVLENLGPGRKYYYRVSTSNGTVTKDSPYYDFSMPANDELKLVGSPNLSVDNSNKKATLKWDTNLLSSGYVYYNKQGDIQKISGSNTLSVNHEIVLSDLAAGDYNYFFSSTSTPGTVYKSSGGTFFISDSSSPLDSGQLPSASVESPSSSTVSSPSIAKSQSISNAGLYSSLKGKIILKVESKGEAYYVNPGENKMYYLGRPDDAFSAMRNLGIGI